MRASARANSGRPNAFARSGFGHRELVAPSQIDHARAAGRPTLRWWVDERTVPADTGARLVGLGLAPDERLVVLALPLRAELDSPDGIEVVQVTDRADGWGSLSFRLHFPSQAGRAADTVASLLASLPSASR